MANVIFEFFGRIFIGTLLGLVIGFVSGFLFGNIYLGMCEATLFNCGPDFTSLITAYYILLGSVGLSVFSSILYIVYKRKP